MNDILENYYNSFLKKKKTNCSKHKKSFDDKISLKKLSLEKNDILLTDSNIYTFNRNKNFLRSLLFPPFPKLNLKQSILNDKSHSSIRDKFKSEDRPNLQPFEEPKDPLNFTDNKENNINKTSSTFFSINNMKNKTTSSFYSLHKKDKNYQEFLNEKSDFIVENLLNKHKKDIIIKLNKKIINDLDSVEYTDEKAMKMKKVQYKFIFEPSNTKNFCSSDLQIKDLCNKKYRDELLNGVSEYILSRNTKKVKLANRQRKNNYALTQELSRTLKENNWKYHYGGKKMNHNINKKKLPNQININLIRNSQQSLEQRTNELLARTKQLKMFIVKRVNEHKSMKEEINNV